MVKRIVLYVLPLILLACEEVTFEETLPVVKVSPDVVRVYPTENFRFEPKAWIDENNQFDVLIEDYGDSVVEKEFRFDNSFVRWNATGFVPLDVPPGDYTITFSIIDTEEKTASATAILRVLEFEGSPVQSEKLLQANEWGTPWILDANSIILKDGLEVTDLYDQFSIDFNKNRMRVREALNDPAYQSPFTSNLVNDGAEEVKLSIIDTENIRFNDVEVNIFYNSDSTRLSMEFELENDQVFDFFVKEEPGIRGSYVFRNLIQID